jgi:hypothetical protein
MGLVVSPSGEANKQAVGKRMTVGIVKVNWRALLTEPGISGGDPPFDGRSLTPWGKQLGASTPWPDGVKGNGMPGKLLGATGENPQSSDKEIGL